MPLDNFIKPSAMGGSGGDGLRITDLEGHLLIIIPTEEETVIETSRGPAEARPVKVLDVDFGDDWQEGIVFQKALRAQLNRAKAADSPLVGRLGKGPAAPGKSAPWLVLDPTDQELAHARSVYLKVTAPF